MNKLIFDDLVAFCLGTRFRICVVIYLLLISAAVSDIVLFLLLLLLNKLFVARVELKVVLKRMQMTPLLLSAIRIHDQMTSFGLIILLW